MKLCGFHADAAAVAFHQAILPIALPARSLT
jgi:hypothetical protein